MKFCPNCRNRLNRVYEVDDMRLYCVMCSQYFPAEVADTLIKSSGEVSSEHPQLYETLIRTCYNDRANPKEKIFCEECDDTIVARYIRITQNMMKVYVCPMGHCIFGNS